MAFSNTLRTMLGFLSSLITRHTPFDLSRDSLEGIYNFLPIGESIITSGQPTEAQFRLVKNAGFLHVINLAPHAAENALPNEPATLESLGIEYIHIPVDFKNPTEEDFAAFCETMGRVGNAPVHVHCAANMRVSAFMSRYRRDVLHHDPEQIAADLHEIWEPFGAWRDFIKR
jgi:protein tyrosine phosphatase (PTP) superfamily phosphohydrolase (DUF442 family)